MITGNRKDIEVALKSPSNMEDYLASAPAVQIIADIKAYGYIDRVKIATAAMQGLCARNQSWDNMKELAKKAVEIADALIAELNKPQS